MLTTSSLVGPTQLEADTSARWIWPLPRLGGCDPSVVRDDLDDALGVDLGYVRPFDGRVFVPVYAAQTGVISSVSRTSSGFTIGIDHGARCSTRYGHLEYAFAIATHGRRRRPERVRGGDVIGYAARAPIRVRFELWRPNDGDRVGPVAPRLHADTAIARGVDARSGDFVPSRNAGVNPNGVECCSPGQRPRCTP